MNHHKQKPVFCQWQNTDIDVDEKLAPLIEWLWAHGIRTYYSCQGEFTGNAYIMFDGGIAADIFVAGVCSSAGESSTLSHLVNNRDHETGEGWDWSPAYYEGKVRWTVRFPKHHIEEIEEALGICQKHHANVSTETPAAIATGSVENEPPHL